MARDPEWSYRKANEISVVTMWGGVQSGQNLIVLYKEDIFMNNDIINREWRTRFSLTHFEDNFWIDRMPQLFFRPKYVWFPVYL